MDSNSILNKFIQDQLSIWPFAAQMFRGLKNLETKEIEIDGLRAIIQHNPGRVHSTDAKIDDESIKARKCFLCEGNRIEGQNSMPFEGRKGRKYDIVLNPYPIFPKHLVVVGKEHTPQSIANNFVDIADLSHHYTDFSFFYNGPKCGASAPDHLHFQACPHGLMPLEIEADRLLDLIAANSADEGVPNGEERPIIPATIENDIEYLSSVQEAQAFHYKHFTHGIFFLRARTSKSMAKLFYRLLDCADIAEGEYEPRFNLVSWYKASSPKSRRPAGNTHGLSDFEYRTIVVLRKQIRSHHYSSTGSDHLRITAGCAEIMGVLVAPDGEDLKKANSELIRELINEVTVSQEVEQKVIWRMTRKQKEIQVGILSADEIAFEIISDGAGVQKVSYQEGKIAYNGSLYDELYFEAKTLSTQFAEPTFILHDVTIGIDFHWQRKQDQTFAGALKFIIDNGKVTAVNVIGIEDYLLSVISSEMKSSATLEFLKTHAVISRSWVMSQIRGNDDKSKKLPEELNKELNSIQSVVTHIESQCKKEKDQDELTVWLDHNDHQKFDVCADDHCQRYQGLSIAVGENVRKAIDQTWGQVLTKNGEICDARFYKCCGGKTELFSTCWEDKDYDYLPSLPDSPGHDPEGHCFCDTDNEEILSQVLNGYDLETKDFYKWEVEYGRDEISEIVARRSGIDFGTILDLVPLKTGPSGRIFQMEFIGSKRRMKVGKELIIRKWLSESHLKSSAFSIEWTSDNRLILKGRGWGHGVGLCQIGAAVMAYEGYTYDLILKHYYPSSELKK